MVICVPDVYVQLYRYTCMHVCTYVCMYACVSERLYACMHVCVPVCMYVFTCCRSVYPYVYSHMCMYI